MKKIIVKTLVLLIVFGCVSCLSSGSSSSSVMVTQISLEGKWENESGKAFTFRGNNYVSNSLNRGIQGTYEIYSGKNSSTITFYAEDPRNSVGPGFFFQPVRIARMEALLKEGGNILILDDSRYEKR